MSARVNLSEILSILHFIPEVSTLYQVEPGPEFRLIDSNARAQFLGVGPASFHGKLVRQFIPQEFYERQVLPRLRQVIELRTTVQFSNQPPFPSVHESMDFHLTPILNQDGECTHIWVITKYKKKSEDLEHLAFHDALTGVPNRLFFSQRLQRCLSRYKEHNIPFSVMVIDCDNFKWVNDSFGHEVGDLVLRGLADQIKSCLRQQDIVARFGGDEFAVISEDGDHGRIAIEYAKQILKLTEQPWKIKGHEFFTTISIGIAHATDPINVDDILSLADKALYAVKIRGRNGYAVYEDPS